MGCPPSRTAELGPPPRARGPHLHQPSGRDEAGTTPACAGTTREEVAEQDALGGTTPACAGTTPHPARYRQRRQDHPRVRGDHTTRLPLTRAPVGPPPRARGPLESSPRQGAVRGTTPACAGTTARDRKMPWARRDHPRVRGDHVRYSICPGCSRGPPPRARGPPVPMRRRERAAGTTPACAGTTTRRQAPACRRRDHPRVRGDHRPVLLSPRSSSGPPPRARGPQLPEVLHVPGHGTTPACAGTTAARCGLQA